MINDAAAMMIAVMMMVGAAYGFILFTRGSSKECRAVDRSRRRVVSRPRMAEGWHGYRHRQDNTWVDTMEVEQWKPIIQHRGSGPCDGLFEISSMGRVRRHTRTAALPKGYLLKPRPTSKAKRAWTYALHDVNQARFYPRVIRLMADYWPEVSMEFGIAWAEMIVSQNEVENARLLAAAKDKSRKREVARLAARKSSGPSRRGACNTPRPEHNFDDPWLVGAIRGAAAGVVDSHLGF